MKNGGSILERTTQRCTAWLSGLPLKQLRAAEEDLLAGRASAARERLLAIVERAPHWAEAWHLLGRVAAARGERDEEERCEREALARDPSHVGAEEALLEVQAWRHKPLMDAWAHYHARRWLEAAEAFYAALLACGARVPVSGRAEALAGLGWCRLELALPGAAADAFWEALGAAPGDVSARRGLAIAWFQLGRYTEAEALLSELLAQRPEFGVAHAFHGWCAYAQGRHAEALARFERACAADPSLADARWGRGWSLWRLGRRDAAACELRSALELAPAHPSAGDALDLAVSDPAFDTLIEPLARGLVRVHAGVVATAARERALARGCVEAAARIEAIVASASSDPALDALEALVLRRDDALERATASTDDDSQRLRLAWVRARACELQGNFRLARQIVAGLAPRHASRLEWRELATRIGPEGKQ